MSVLAAYPCPSVAMCSWCLPVHVSLVPGCRSGVQRSVFLPLHPASVSPGSESSAGWLQLLQGVCQTDGRALHWERRLWPPQGSLLWLWSPHQQTHRSVHRWADRLFLIVCHLRGPESMNLKLSFVSAAREGATCVFGGMVYKNGESFQSSCKYQCTCLDGAVGCVPLCSMDIRLPSPDCPMPKRVKVPGKCCEEWICESPQKNSFAGTALAGESREMSYLSLPTSIWHTQSSCLIQGLFMCLQHTEKRRLMVQILIWWGRTAWFRLLNGVPAPRPVALGYLPGSPMTITSAGLKSKPGCAWWDHASPSWSRASGWVLLQIWLLKNFSKTMSQCFHQRASAKPSFSTCRKGKSASALPGSPSPWSLRSQAAPPPSPTGQSSAASAWTAAAAPPTGPPPCPWSSSAPMGRWWRSTWCSSSPAPATTTAPGRTTSSRLCITRRWSATWREPPRHSPSPWLEKKQNSISVCSSVYLPFEHVIFPIVKVVQRLWMAQACQPNRLRQRAAQQL